MVPKEVLSYIYIIPHNFTNFSKQIEETLKISEVKEKLSQNHLYETANRLV